MSRINRIISYYSRAYYKAAAGRESGRQTIEGFKKIIKAEHRPKFYEHAKKMILRLVVGPFYWPNTFPTSVDPAVGELLYALIRILRPEIVVEIGTAKGYSAIAIAQALEDNNKGKLYTIDPVEQELVKIAIKKSGLGHRINYIIDYSTNAIPRLKLPKIDFIFIDGDHSYENVSADFDLVKDSIPKGGLIAFHDTILFDGPRRVIEEIKKLKQFEIITLPTLTGVDKSNSAVLAGNSVDDFTPVGFTICRKI